MIEFRWFERGGELHIKGRAVQASPGAVIEVGSLNDVHHSPMERVLQYRILVDVIQPTTISSVTQVTRVDTPRKEWSLWMDVPIVRVGDLLK